MDKPLGERIEEFLVYLDDEDGEIELPDWTGGKWLCAGGEKRWEVWEIVLLREALVQLEQMEQEIKRLKWENELLNEKARWPAGRA